MKAVLATRPQNKVAEQGLGIGATDEGEEDHKKEHNWQEGNEQGMENKMTGTGADQELAHAQR